MKSSNKSRIVPPDEMIEHLQAVLALLRLVAPRGGLGSTVLSLCGKGSIGESLDIVQDAMPKVPWIYEARAKWLELGIEQWDQRIRSSRYDHRLHSALSSDAITQSPGGMSVGTFAKYATVAFLGERWLGADILVLLLFQRVRDIVKEQHGINSVEFDYWEVLMLKRILHRAERSHGGVVYGDTFVVKAMFTRFGMYCIGKDQLPEWAESCAASISRPRAK